MNYGPTLRIGSPAVAVALGMPRVQKRATPTQHVHVPTQLDGAAERFTAIVHTPTARGKRRRRHLEA